MIIWVQRLLRETACRRSRVNFRWLASLLLLVTLMAGCGGRYDYKWNEYRIDVRHLPGMAVIQSSGPVSIVESQNDILPQLILQVGSQTLFASHQNLGAAIVWQLTKELEKRQVVVAAGAPKQIEISITGIRIVRTFATNKSILDVDLKLPVKIRRSLHIENPSPANLWRSLNGAVALMVVKILKDPDVLAYLAE